MEKIEYRYRLKLKKDELKKVQVSLTRALEEAEEMGKMKDKAIMEKSHMINLLKYEVFKLEKSLERAKQQSRDPQITSEIRRSDLDGTQSLEEAQ